MAHITGDGSALGIALNAVTAGEGWDGTPGTYDVIRVDEGGLSWDDKVGKKAAAIMRVNPAKYINGGRSVPWNIDAPMSYSLLEKLVYAMLGANTTTGASAPYSHAMTPADGLIFMSLKGWYFDPTKQANQICSTTLKNAVPDTLTISVKHGEEVRVKASGMCASATESEIEAAMPSISEHEFILHEHLTATVDGKTTIDLSEAEVSIEAGIEDGNYKLGSPEILRITRGGSRLVKWGFTQLEKRGDALLASMTTDFTGTNSFVFNNGLLGAAERELSIVLGASTVMGAPVDGRFSWSIATRKFSLEAYDASSPRIIAVTFKNAVATPIS